MWPSTLRRSRTHREQIDGSGSATGEFEELENRVPRANRRGRLDPAVEVGRQLRAAHPVRQIEVEVAALDDECLRLELSGVELRDRARLRVRRHESDVHLRQLDAGEGVRLDDLLEGGARAQDNGHVESELALNGPLDALGSDVAAGG